jgi:glyoxylase-like metal-dependent hydrolase (beta-lactamase superfamily II)
MLLFRQLFDLETNTYTYILGDTAAGVAAIVDPVDTQAERDLALLAELGLQLRYSIETHIHADHVTAASALKAATGCVTVVPEGANAACADRAVRDGEVLTAGGWPIAAIATPGHTDSHMAYLAGGERLLTGDALFVRGCGRTDFQGGDAGTLYDSVTQRLFTLPEATRVYPGHDYRGHTVSTIGEEKRHNPRFAGRTREAFVRFMAELKLPLPHKIMEAVPANERCGRLADAA